MKKNNGQVTADEWGLIAAESDLAALSLEEVLMFGEQKKDVPDGDRLLPYNRISMRFLQPTLMLELSFLRRKPHITLSAVERLVTKHGVLLLREDATYQHLSEARGAWEQEMHSHSYANDTVANMTQNSAFAPTGCIERRSTISLYSWVHSDIVDFANDAALQLQFAVQFCMLTSLATLEKKGGYHKVVVEDLQRIDKQMLSCATRYQQLKV